MKDAQGHGSNGRGGSAWPKQQPIRNVPTLAQYGAKTQNAGMTDAFKADAWSSTPGGDREAASTLSSGGPKSDPVPVHDSMAGGHGQDWGDRDSNGVSTKGDYGKNLSDAYQTKHGWSGDVGAQPDHTARRAASLARVSY